MVLCCHYYAVLKRMVDAHANTQLQLQIIYHTLAYFSFSIIISKQSLLKALTQVFINFVNITIQVMHTYSWTFPLMQYSTHTKIMLPCLMLEVE